MRVCAVLCLLGFRPVHFKPELPSWRLPAQSALFPLFRPRPTNHHIPATWSDAAAGHARTRTLKTAHPDFFISHLTSFPIFPLVSLDSSQFFDQVLDRLVSASFIRYRTFTADLSPGSLPGVLLLSNGTLLLEVGFTLRCLQRLSRPHFASQLCHWHDNCCTSDASTPVLSY